MPSFLKKYLRLWLLPIKSQVTVIALVKYRSYVYLVSAWRGKKVFRNKPEDLEGDLLLKGDLAKKWRGPQCADYTVESYFYKKERYVGIYKELTHHHPTLEKKTQEEFWNCL